MSQKKTQDQTEFNQVHTHNNNYLVASNYGATVSLLTLSGLQFASFAADFPSITRTAFAAASWATAATFGIIMGQNIKSGQEREHQINAGYVPPKKGSLVGAFAKSALAVALAAGAGFHGAQYVAKHAVDSYRACAKGPNNNDQVEKPETRVKKHAPRR